MKLNNQTAVKTDIKTIGGVIIAVAISVYSYFTIVERINALEVQDQLQSADLLKKADQTPRNLEFLMLIEHNTKILEKHQELLDENIHSQVMIKNLEKDLDEAEDKIEYLLNLTRKLNGNSN